MRRPYSLSLLMALTALAPVVPTTTSMARAPTWVQPVVPEDGLRSYVPGPEHAPQAEAKGPQALSDDELSGLRGGFVTTNGFTFGFGVVIRSYINNELALKTQLTWTPAGPVTTQVQGNVPGVTDLASAVTALVSNGIDLTAITGGVPSAGGAGSAGGAASAGAGGAGGAGTPGGASGSSGAGSAGSAGGADSVGGAGNAAGAGGTGSAANTGNAANTANTANTVVAGGIIGGVALVDGNGATALIHSVTAGQLQSLIVNNANNRNLRQDMELNLFLPDLATIQANSVAQQRVSQLTYDLNTSLVGALGR